MAVLWLRDLGARSEKASDGLDEVFTVLEVLPAVAAIKCWRVRLLRVVSLCLLIMTGLGIV